MRVEYVIEQLKIDRKKLVQDLHDTLEICQHCQEIKEAKIEKDLICKIDSIDVEIEKLVRENKLQKPGIPIGFKSLILLLLIALAYKTSIG